MGEVCHHEQQLCHQDTVAELMSIAALLLAAGDMT